jgi:arginyl-tRNA synthetase
MEEGDVSLLTDPKELTLIRKLIELPEIVELCVGELAPHKLAFWAHEELARAFHPTYDEIRALHSDVPEDLARARLKLYAAARIVLARTLDLMGMNAPDMM